MKYFVSVLLVLLLVTGVASAQVNTWRHDFTTAGGSLTQLGWGLAANSQQDIIDQKSRDYSSGWNDWGIEDLKILDNNVPTNAYMRMYYNPTAAPVDSSRGMLMLRMACWPSSNVGTFGYAVGTTSRVVQIRSGANINIKDAAGSGSGSSVAFAGPIDTWRVYALKWGAGVGSNGMQLWVSNGGDWSSNSADWSEINVGGFTFDGCDGLIDENGVRQNGLLLGSFGTSSSTSNVSIDWLAYSRNDMYWTPWDLNPIPEPGSMLALASGLIGMAGFALRRRRA